MTREIQAADLDGDGDQDLVFGCVGHTTYASRIYLNDGTGHFQLAQEFLADPLGFRIRLGDVDGDGDLDLTMWGRNGLTQVPRLYLNDGTGHFTRTSGWLPTLGIEQGGDLGDVDGDGDLDIVAGYYGWLVPPGPNPGEYRTLALWLNDGTGHFVAASDDSTPTVNQAYYMFPTTDLGDIDGDGDLDVLTGFDWPYAPTHSEVLWNLKRHLYPPHEAHLGQTYELDVWADTGHVVGAFLALGGAHFDLGALGVFALDPATTFSLPGRLVPASRELVYRFPISTDAVLLGLTLHWQAIDVDPNDLTRSRLMAKYEDTIMP